MFHEGGIHTVQKVLQDINSKKKLFGGITIIFSGDFRQILLLIQMIPKMMNLTPV